MDTLPVDVLFKLFEGLGLKELRGLTRVSKSLAAVVSCSEFVKVWNKKHPQGDGAWMLLSRIDSRCSYYDRSRWTLMAATYGLMCFVCESKRNELVVYNPQTLKCRQLKPPKTVNCVGLHYDKNRDSYRVAVLSYVRGYTNSSLYLDIYDSGSKEWVHQCSYPIGKKAELTSPIVWMDGAFYWTCGTSAGLKQNIVRFNEATKTWVEVSLTKKRIDGFAWGDIENLHVWNNELYFKTRKCYPEPHGLNQYKELGSVQYVTLEELVRVSKLEHQVAEAPVVQSERIGSNDIHSDMKTPVSKRKEKNKKNEENNMIDAQKSLTLSEVLRCTDDDDDDDLRGRKRMTLTILGTGHGCFALDKKKDLFRDEYYVPPKFCDQDTEGSCLFSFQPGLATV